MRLVEDSDPSLPERSTRFYAAGQRDASRQKEHNPPDVLATTPQSPTPGWLNVPEGVDRRRALCRRSCRRRRRKRGLASTQLQKVSTERELASTEDVPCVDRRWGLRRQKRCPALTEEVPCVDRASDLC